MAIREYQIKELGEFNNFLIDYFDNKDHGVEPGYYGVQGMLTITERCETLEEAEEALKTAIGRRIGKEIKGINKRKSQLTEIISGIIGPKADPEGLKKYINFDGSQ